MSCDVSIRLSQWTQAPSQNLSYINIMNDDDVEHPSSILSVDDVTHLI